MIIRVKYRQSGHVDLRRLRRCARRLFKAYSDIGLGKPERFITKAMRRFNK